MPQPHLRNRREIRDGSKHRFDRQGSLVGDEIQMNVRECIDCGEAMLVVTIHFENRSPVHAPIHTESIPGMVGYLIGILESAREDDDG